MTDDKPIQVRVLASLSCPRLGFTDPLFIAARLLTMNIELRKAGGAYWEQGISRLLYHALDNGFDYVCTIDYDSVFRPGDVWYLLKLIHACPDAAAVFPVQYRREADEIILGLPGAKNGDAPMGALDDHLALASTGHFGLTMIRLAAIKDIPHPWLWSQPGSNGRWDAPDRVDADIYFWNKLRAHGRKLYCASRCVIGHMQQMVTWRRARTIASSISTSASISRMAMRRARWSPPRPIARLRRRRHPGPSRRLNHLRSFLSQETPMSKVKVEILSDYPVAGYKAGEMLDLEEASANHVLRRGIAKLAVTSKPKPAEPKAAEPKPAEPKAAERPSASIAKA